MNPYVSFGLAMCVIVVLALAGTSYLAVYFNRKAQQDLKAALTPLAELIEGTIDLEEATVSGRYRGHLAKGVVSTLPGGMGRVFLISLIDGAGGQRWLWTLTRSKHPGIPPTGAFEEVPDNMASLVQPAFDELTVDPTLAAAWFRIEYDPAPGHVRLTKPMRTRRDIPDAGSFGRILDALFLVAAGNRQIQGPK